MKITLVTIGSFLALATLPLLLTIGDEEKAHGFAARIHAPDFLPKLELEQVQFIPSGINPNGMTYGYPNTLYYSQTSNPTNRLPLYLTWKAIGKDATGNPILLWGIWVSGAAPASGLQLTFSSVKATSLPWGIDQPWGPGWILNMWSGPPTAASVTQTSTTPFVLSGNWNGPGLPGPITLSQ